MLTIKPTRKVGQNKKVAKMTKEKVGCELKLMKIMSIFLFSFLLTDCCCDDNIGPDSDASSTDTANSDTEIDTVPESKPKNCEPRGICICRLVLCPNWYDEDYERACSYKWQICCMPTKRIELDGGLDAGQ